MTGKSIMERRDFLGAAALGMASLGALGLSGCASNASSSGASDGLSATGAAATVGVPETWDREADVVVIGSGTVLSAAVKAVADGLETIILEKAPMAGAPRRSRAASAISAARPW